MENICVLIKTVLQENRCDFSIDDCLNMELYYEGVVDKEYLSELIKLALENKLIEPLLGQVVEKFINAESVDLNNFKALLNYKGKYRKTLLWGLSHTPLSFYQMQILFDKYYKDFPEITCNIISTIYMNDCFTEYDMEYYLNRVKEINLKSIMDISALIASVPTNNKTKSLSKYL